MRLIGVTTSLLLSAFIAVGCGGSGGGSSNDAGGGGSGGSGGSAGVTYESDIKTILSVKCAPCHEDRGNAALFHTMASSYKDVMKDAKVCPGKKVGECGVIRVKKGEMPYQKMCTGDPTKDGANNACLTAAEIAKLDAWVANGLKEK